MIRKILILNVILIISIFACISKCNSKYVIRETLNVADTNIPVELIDNESPKIFGYEEANIISISKEEFWTNNNVIIKYSDNIAVKSATYQYNPNSKEFDDCKSIDFESGIEFVNEGWYKVVVTDYYENVTTKIILIDKTAPIIDNIENDKVYRNELSIGNIVDNLSGIKTAKIYYNSKENVFDDLNSKSLFDIDSIKDIGFYKIVLTDIVGNDREYSFIINDGLISIDVIGNNSYHSESIQEESSGWCNIDSNIKITSKGEVKSSVYYFNSNSKSFENSKPINLKSGDIVKEEGYYKVEATNVFGDTVSLIFGIDKTPPTIDGIENNEIYIVE